jgi:hypothetical protein
MDRKTQLKVVQKLARLARLINDLPDPAVAGDLKEIRSEAKTIQTWVDAWYVLDSLGLD